MSETGPGVSNISVTGGAGGSDAFYEDLAAMGDLTDDVAGSTLTIAMTSHKYLADPDVLASGILNPGGLVKFEATMLGALDGPSGLTATSAAIGVRGLTLQATNQAYQFVDDLNAKALEAGRWLAGAAVAINPALGAAGLAAIATDVYLNYDGDWQKWLVEHPGMIDTILGMSPGALSALGLPTDLATLTEFLAAAYPDGDPKLIDQGMDLDPRTATPPQNLGDLMDGLDYRNAQNSDKPNEGSNIDVRAIKDANGNITGYVVDIPGTKVWNAPFMDDKNNANDFGTNIDGIAGNETVLQEGIEQALRDAGVPKDAPVMLVGHSQGGIVAARAANDFVNNGTYNVTHVVTAGSPVGNIPIPDSVQMLSLENNGDVVPHLDARENPDADNRTTVKFDNQTNTAGGNHAISGPDGQDGNYEAAARQIDSGNDPSVRRFVDSAGAFLNGESADSHQYKVERQP
ncbi:lipase family protein [Actinokineospora xionganensis]|uniref:Alpha/beta hydrolase n=1 Tax=Actinokineospora xionganensis TaxID=2684470 RepID=A0ABR7L201_9PSEU|nr:alpha/beta hydrolase [Actinokineospora xionganensis]MBC6446713.1 alpha/beta hydrolase [Actinokineospora xionganensis]